MFENLKILYLGKNEATKSIIGLNDLIKVNDFNYFVIIGIEKPKKKQDLGLKQKLYQRLFNNFDIKLPYNSLIELCKAKNIPYQIAKTPRHLKLNKDAENFKADFLISNGWGWIISDEIINIPSIKALNCHSSLLPNYRGGSVFKHVLMNYEKKTGVTVHELTSKIDRGNIYAQKEIEIDRKDTPNKLLYKISNVSALVIRKGIENLLSEKPQIIKNNLDDFYAKKISVKDYIKYKIKNKIRVFFGLKPKRYAISNNEKK